jgi:fibronectin-binding autotransporter adhesin
MKKMLNFRFLFALFVAIVPQTGSCVIATNFFHDTFGNGSTINSLTPASPTSTNASYQVISAKGWVPNPPTITSGDLKFGIASTTSGSIEVQARFATNPVALVEVGNSVRMTVVFVNGSNILTGSGFPAFGLYGSGDATGLVQPVAGGLNSVANNGVTTNATGGVQNWAGYVGQLAYTGGNNRIMTRAAQTTGTDNRNQDLVTSGSGSSSYGNPGAATIGANSASTLTLTNGQTCTDVLTVTLIGTSVLAITNSLYSGADTNGTLLAQFGGVATNTTYMTSGFDGLAIGIRETANNGAVRFDIASIDISGEVTIITGPPTITSQPVDVSVATNGTCPFTVAADGFTMTYQWYRNGTNLLNGGNISGVTTPTLVVSSAGPADELSGANGYYVKVTGAGGYSTNSAICSLALRPATNLIWTAVGGNDWDVNTSFNWKDTNDIAAVFNYGDPVLFDDTASTRVIHLMAAYLSAGSVTVDSQYKYTFSGTGSYSGSGSLLYKGTGQLDIINANTYTGGTTISNSAADLYLENYNGLGTGPLTLAAGMLEIPMSAGTSAGIPGNVFVADDFTLMLGGTGAYGTVLFGNLSGTTNKTLTVDVNNPTNTVVPVRVRLYGTSTVYDGNLLLNNSLIFWSPYAGSGSQTYNGVISGSGGLVQKGAATYLNALNLYSGGTLLTGGGVLGFGTNSVGSPVTSGPIGTGPLVLAIDSTTGVTGNGQVFAAGDARTIGNLIQFQSGTNNLTLTVGGTKDLTFTTPINLAGNDNLTTNTINSRFIQVTNTALTTLSGVISDTTNSVSAAYGLTKTGNGILALTADETYTGPTTNSAGTLQVNGSLNAASAVTVATNATLAGTGTINGAVTVQLGGTLAPGTSIGQLTINSNLALNGNLFFELNKSLSTNDYCAVSGTLANSGTGSLAVTNYGGTALTPGDKFYLFNKAMTGGGSLSVNGSGVLWSNGLAVDGSITVLPPTPPTIITQPTNRAVARGSSATLSVTVSTLSGVTNYLWQLNSNTITAGNVSGTNSRALTITNFQAANVGYYRVTIDDGLGDSTNSANANLTLAVSPTMASGGVSGTTFTLQIPTEPGPSYVVQTNSNLLSTNWQTAGTINGDGATKPFTTSITNAPQLFIRLKVQ